MAPPGCPASVWRRQLLRGRRSPRHGPDDSGARWPPGGCVNHDASGGGTAAGGAVMAIRTIREQDGKARPGLTSEQVWQAVARASFAVLSHVTPGGEPRSSGVVYKAMGRRLVVAV